LDPERIERQHAGEVAEPPEAGVLRFGAAERHTAGIELQRPRSVVAATLVPDVQDPVRAAERRWQDPRDHRSGYTVQQEVDDRGWQTLARDVIRDTLVAALQCDPPPCIVGLDREPIRSVDP